MIVGREEEIGKLMERLYDVSLVGAQFIAIKGSAGIGKSTLLKEYIQNLPDWAKGIFLKFDYDKGSFAVQLGRILPYQTHDVGSILLGFYQFLSVQRGPVVIGIDDVDFENEFFRSFVENLRIYSVEVVVTHRSGDIPPEFEIISLSPWNLAEMRRFYRLKTGHEPDVEVLVNMEMQTRGIPLLCEKFIRGEHVSGVKTRPRETDETPVLRELARKLQSQGKHEGAFEILNQLVARETDKREKELLKLEILQNWSLSPKKAREILESVDTDYLNDREKREYILLRGYIFYRLLDFEDALRVFDDFLRRYPDSPEFSNALVLRGESRYYLGKIREAEGDFRKVLKMEEDGGLRFMAYRGLALIDIYRMRYKGAMASIRRMEAIAQSLKNYAFIQIALSLKADLLATTGKINEAYWLFYKAIKMSREIGVNYYFALHKSFDIYFVNLDFQNLVNRIKYLLEKPIPDRLGEALLHLTLARAFVELENPREAEEELEKFSALMPEKHAWEKVVWRIKAYIYLLYGEVEKARGILDKIKAPVNSALHVQNRILKYTILAKEGKKKLARRRFISLIRMLDGKDAYRFLVFAAYRASKLFPEDKDFSSLLPSGETHGARMGIFLLGPFKIMDLKEEREIFDDRLKSAKLREFIALMGLSKLISKDGRLSRHYLKEKLWPFFDETRQNKNLSWVVSKFREIFGKDAIIRQGDFLMLNRKNVYLDVDRFVEFYNMGKMGERKGRNFEALEYFKKAIEIVSGRPFEGIYSVNSFENAYQFLMGMVEHAFHRVCEIYLNIDKPEEAREIAEYARTLFPYNESFYQFIVKSYLLEGNRLQARRILEELQRIYTSEFGEPFTMEI